MILHCQRSIDLHPLRQASGRDQHREFRFLLRCLFQDLLAKSRGSWKELLEKIPHLFENMQ